MQNHRFTLQQATRLSVAVFLSCASLDVGGVAVAAETDPRLDMVAELQAAGPQPSLGDQANVFSRLVGAWDIGYAFFSKDGATTLATGAFSAGWVMDGRVMQCLYTIDPSATRKEKFIGTSLSYFDVKSQTWRLFFIDPENDAVIRVTGGAVGNDRIMFLTQETDGKTYRWSFNDIRPDAFVYRDEISRDGGNTWTLREEDHMKRRAP
jgi:hypothetical protein